MKLISHRGLNNHEYKENSREAIISSLNEDYIAGVEIDIRLTKDKKLVLYHDKLINIGIDKEKYVKNLTLSELKTYTNNTVCELNELLIELNTNKEILIEIKYEDNNYKEIVDIVYETIKNYLNLNIKICSFNKDVISYFKKKYKNYQVGLIIGIKKNKYRFFNFYNFNSISILHHKLLKNNDYVWTIDDINTFNMLKNKGKNIAIITNKAYLFKDIND